MLIDTDNIMSISVKISTDYFHEWNFLNELYIRNKLGVWNS